MRKNNVVFDKASYDDFYNNKNHEASKKLPKFSKFSYNAIFGVDKNIYIFLFGVLTSYSAGLFVLLKDVSFADWKELIVLAIGILSSIVDCWISMRFVIMVINLQEASQTALLRDVIENKERSATNKNLFDFNCLINHVFETKSSLDDLTNDEKSELLKRLKSIKTRIVWILILLAISLISVVVMMVLGNV